MSTNFSESEIKLLTRAWLCVEGGMPKIDTDKLAAECGYTVGSAKVVWGALRRKLIKVSEGGGDKAAAATPKKATPKKRKAAAEGDGVTPKKRGRKSKAEREAMAAAAAGEEDDEEEMKGEVKKEEVDAGGDGFVKEDDRESDEEA